METPDRYNAVKIDAYDYLANAASSCDCTGLIPAGEGLEEELEAYREIYKFGAPALPPDESS